MRRYAPLRISEEHRAISMSALDLLGLAQQAFRHGDSAAGIAEPLHINYLGLADMARVGVGAAAVFAGIDGIICPRIAEMLCIGCGFATGLAGIDLFSGGFFRSRFFYCGLYLCFCCHAVSPCVLLQLFGNLYKSFTK